jgi:hypothetical protein
MSGNGTRDGKPERRLIGEAVAARRRADLVGGLRGLVRAPAPAPAPAANGNGNGAGVAEDEVCDMCGVGIPEDHRHLLHLAERRILCACEPCWAMRSGEGDYRPVGSRTLWLPELDLPDDLWASFQVPIGLAFFMQSTVTECVVAMYPSPAGATESELHFESWSRMCELNPVLNDLEPDVEGLIVNRMREPVVYAIAPIDQCYALTGLIKTRWEGISGGPGLSEAVDGFFARLESDAVAG